MADFTLSDVNVVAVSICKGPANRRRIFLKKHEGIDEKDLITSPAPKSIIRKAEGDSWRVFYSVVAEPGWEEQCGVGEGAIPGTTDMWASEDEIRKAAHSFMRGGGLINLQHKDLEAVGRVVENFIAPADMAVLAPDGTEETIKKGAWVIGIEPDDALRQLIDSGELDGVSYEGTGIRTAVAKVSSRTYPSLERVPGKQNWVDAAGGLPDYIERIAKHLHYEQGMTIGRAIATAVSRCRVWARGGDGVSPDTQAKAARAISQWESKKKRGSVKKSTPEEEGSLSDMSLLRKIAEKVGLSADEIEAEFEGLSDEEKALLSKGGSLTNSTQEEDDVALTDEQQAALAKVDQIDATVSDLVKDDGRLARIESSLVAIAEHLKPEPTDEERRANVEETIQKMATDLAKAQEDLAALAEGGSSQNPGPDTLKKNDDPDAALASALFG